MEKEYVLFLLSMVLVSSAYATDIGIINCASLDTPGETYVLVSDIRNSSAMECLQILANDVTLDCRGHTVEGRNLSDTFGIFVNGVSGANVKNCVAKNWFYGVVSVDGDYNAFINITSASSKRWGFVIANGIGNTVRNLTVSGSESFGVDLWNASESTVEDVRSFDNRGDGHGFVVDTTASSTLRNIKCFNNAQNGLYLYYSDNNEIEDVDSYQNNMSGLYLYHSTNNTFKNLTSRENNDTGFRLLYSDGNTIKNSRTTKNAVAGMYLEYSQSNHVYNNLFNNSAYAITILGGNYTNIWNTTRQAGNRINSPGAEIAGNFWAAPPGDGYSEVCDDVNKDGFCDTAYGLASGNIDYLPLSNKYVGCALAGDNPPCGQVTLSEVVTLINKWSVGQAALSQVIALINAWAG